MGNGRDIMYVCMYVCMYVTGGKPIFWYQSILDVSAVNPLVAFYDIYRSKG
jgi:hypothetical protein